MSGNLPTSVKTHHGWLTGSPQLTGTAGSAINVLDAVLVTGWGLLAASSLVVSGGVATATFTAAHGFEADTTVASVSGITGPMASMNGEHRITATPNTLSIQFAAAGVSDGTATGAISIKVAPLGWEKVFSGTNKAVYKSTAPESLGMYLRVDDTSATDIRVSGFESMSDADTGTGQFDALYPTAGGGYWPKSATAGATARNWLVCGDERGFHFWVVPNSPQSVSSQGQGYWFGDLAADSSIDAFACLLESEAVSVNASPTATSHMVVASQGATTGVRLPRSYSQLGEAISGGIYAASRLFNSVACLSGQGPANYPNLPDNALLLDPVVITDGGSRRGVVPGLYHTPQNVGFAFRTRSMIEGQGPLADRALVAMRCAAPYFSSQNNSDGPHGCAFVDVIGPWR